MPVQVFLKTKSVLVSGFDIILTLFPSLAPTKMQYNSTAMCTADVLG